MDTEQLRKNLLKYPLESLVDIYIDNYVEKAKLEADNDLLKQQVIWLECFLTARNFDLEEEVYVTAQRDRVVPRLPELIER